MSISNEKLNQTQQVLKETKVDCWMILTRESIENNDPMLPFFYTGGVVWVSAFMFFASGRNVAIVGKHDADAVEAEGVFAEVIPYVQGIKKPLLKVLEEEQPRQIALDYSKDNTSADGLSHGLFCTLQDMLAGTSFDGQTISAEGLIGKIKGQKTPTEIARIKRAIDITEDYFNDLEGFVRPGIKLEEVTEFLHGKIAADGYGFAWSRDHNPSCTTGPGMAASHFAPAGKTIEPGHCFHIDFGIKTEGYCSDLQRTWYLLRGGESDAPDDVKTGFRVAYEAIQAAAKILKPGVQGWQVDKVGRDYLTSHGYEEYQHALGHQVGVWAHDGGMVLAPRWERYGEAPNRKVEAGNVFTLELEVMTSAGFIGLEEIVEVTESGCRFLSKPQSELRLINAAASR